VSNVVRFDDGQIVLRAYDIDIPRFRAWYEAIPNAYPAEWDINATQAENDVRCVQWYLQGNLWFEGNSVRIVLGRGRSEHTWRDLRWLCSVLKPFMRRERSRIFTARDESDGMRRPFKLKITFGAENPLGE
jgi:hypothetical protein